VGEGVRVVRACVSVSDGVCVYVYVLMFWYVDGCVNACACACVCVCVCMCICVWVRVCVCV